MSSDQKYAGESKRLSEESSQRHCEGEHKRGVSGQELVSGMGSPGWACNKCTYFVAASDGIAHEVCPQCKTPREYLWKCNSCTVISSGLIRKCKTCGAINEEIEKIKVARYPDNSWDCPLCLIKNSPTSSHCSNFSKFPFCGIGPETILLDDVLSDAVLNPPELRSWPPASSLREIKGQAQCANVSSSRKIKGRAQSAGADSFSNEVTNFSLALNGKNCGLKLIEHFGSVNTTYFATEPIDMLWKITHSDYKMAVAGEVVGSIAGCVVLNEEKRTMSTVNTKVYRLPKGFYIEGGGKKIFLVEKDNGNLLVPTFFLHCSAEVPPWKK